MKILRTFRSFMLLLAGLAIVAHMTIPHDHHLYGPDNGVRENCPQSHETSHHHPLFPAHCHAFNDLAAEKFSPVIEKQETHSNFTIIIHEALVSGVQFLHTMIPFSGDTIPDIYFADFSPLRAPPSRS